MMLGIDLGTTNSLVAYEDNGTVRLVPNRRGRHVTPSVVGVDPSGTVLVGEAARNQSVAGGERTIRHVKRSVGLRTTLRLGDQRRSPEEVSAVILRHLRNEATAFFGEDQYAAVITVPAHFDDYQRFATVEAALLAGFHTVRLLNEPTAAALPYATKAGREERVTVFDFGGGTLDVTCLERRGLDFAVRATVGDGRLGGADIDGLIAEKIIAEIRRQLGSDTAADPAVRQLVVHLSEQAKIDLSELHETRIAVPFLPTGSGTGHFSMTLSRLEFERALDTIIARAVELTDQAIREAGFDRSGFDALVLAGGSSRIPAVRRALEERYRLPAATRINPEEVIATGAALYARSLENGGSADASFKLRDVLSGTLAIELADGSCVPIIRKNQTVPTGRTRVFTTVQDEQLEAEIHLVQGNRSQAWRNRSLGRFVLRDIQRAAQGRARIAVSVDVSDNGIVTVRAGDRHTGASHTMTARARPETQKKPVIGRRADYLRSLTRRAEALQQYADPDLREELDDVVQHARARAGDGSDRDDADDVVTVLEALIREIVIGRTEQATGEGRRAAS